MSQSTLNLFSLPLSHVERSLIVEHLIAKDSAEYQRNAFQTLVGHVDTLFVAQKGEFNSETDRIYLEMCINDYMPLWASQHGRIKELHDFKLYHVMVIRTGGNQLTCSFPAALQEMANGKRDLVIFGPKDYKDDELIVRRINKIIAEEGYPFKETLPSKTLSAEHAVILEYNTKLNDLVTQGNNDYSQFLLDFAKAFQNAAK